MAVIVDFPGHTTRKPGQASASGNGAEIVLFPGVRYEYWDAKQPKAKKARRTAKRDLIEIES